ncbi:hypothetical protein EW146_g4575 [Bondarzewia mesenterica]|uniref:Protein kinase domain-containing protein n=1 Tax=Bondarzewia mesenterica TaxID=1095465 RepID=A0A4S4LW99_9AGAM|nr:hypothetical protein EW146_g4575 [Bondarzewia mesenterica]
MDKFKALEPVKLYPSKNQPHQQQQLIGRLPTDLHLLILQYLPVPDIPAYARVSRALAALASSDSLWDRRWRSLAVEEHNFGPILDDLDDRARKAAPDIPPTLDVADDDFGDFASGGSASQGQDLFAPAVAADEMGDFVGAFGGGATLSPRTPALIPALAAPSRRAQYIRAHTLLAPLTAALTSPPHLILTTLFPAPAPSLHNQSKLLHLLARFLSRDVQPLRTTESLAAALRAAVDRFQSTLLAAFDSADSRGDEVAMREAAEASWEIWDPRASGIGEWEMGRVWAEKREIFYMGGTYKPLDNFTPSGGLNFEAMDAFMGFILDAIREHGARAVRVFPPAAGVLISFADRIASEVVGEYIVPLLTRARALANTSIFLKANAASFREAWRMVDAILEVAQERGGSAVQRTQAEDVVYRMFEPNMDEYLDEEVDLLKQTFELICRDWEKNSTAAAVTLNAAQPSFLAASSPAHLKRSVLSSFTNILLLPVTIVPRTVAAVGGTVSGAAVQGISMLDPRRWGGQGGAVADGYQRGGETGVLWDGGEDEDEKDQDTKADTDSFNTGSSMTTVATTSTDATSVSARTYDNLQLLLSLDVTLELIHSARESLKRVETFIGYPGTYGHRVRETIEEVSVEMLNVLGERHVRTGFEQSVSFPYFHLSIVLNVYIYLPNVVRCRAISHMRTYQPPATALDGSEYEAPESTTSVAPLVQFFELVHVGDMIQSIVQLYFDKELAPNIDVTDFLNSVVREKKRFENVLDDSVALGLNAGIEVLMNQVDHIILTLTPPRTYYPPDDAPLLLGPTKGCTEGIRCLEEHLKLLKGNVNREVLEVFEGEVGIASLTQDFANLKMLGHVFVVEDAKDLAQIVRDVTRYGGSYHPEDIYEFIQRRSDWKKIEKVVDKTMYNLNLREDCVVMEAIHVATSKHYAVKILSKAQLVKEKKSQICHYREECPGYTLFRRSSRFHPSIFDISGCHVTLCVVFFPSSDLEVDMHRNQDFVLEFAANGDLGQIVKEHGSLSLSGARYITAQIIDAIQWMHSKGVLHRDLKPENILLNGSMRVKVADFGSAYIAANLDLSPRTSSFVGSAAYVSPELLDRSWKSTSKSSDVWAIGCILYFMIAGVPAFVAVNEYLSFRRIETLGYSFPDGFYEDARDLVQRLLVLTPSDRLGVEPKSSPSELRKHRFFVGCAHATTEGQSTYYIHWETLWTDQAPCLESGLVPPPPHLPREDEERQQDFWRSFAHDGIPSSNPDLDMMESRN